MKEERPRTLAELLHSAGIGAPPSLEESALQTRIEAVVCDSRKVVPGALFVALPGQNTSGHLYLQEALAKGCGVVVAERGLELPDGPFICLPVDNPHQALALLAAAWYEHPARQLRCIAITGTNGKTTTTWLIEGMLAHAGFRPGVVGTVNYRYPGPDGMPVVEAAPLTTPDALTLQALLRRMADAGVSHVVMELSSHALAQERVGGMRFAVAVFTNLSRDHLDYHQDMERYFAAKSLLFSRYLAPGGTAVIAEDASESEEAWGERLAGGLPHVRILRTGFAGHCDIRALAPSYGLDGFSCQLEACGQKTTLHSPLVGAYNVRNVLGAVAVGLGLGLPLEQICTGLATVRAVPGRLQRVLPPGADPALFPSVFVDYAHTPDALDNVLRTLRAVGRGRLVCVFGCGGDRDRGKRPLMGAIAARHSDLVLLTSDNPRTEEPKAILADIEPGLLEGGARACDVEQLFSSTLPFPRYSPVCDRRAAIARACSLAQPEDTVLIAGKGHEDYQILGREKHYFDDCIEAVDALAAWNERLLLAATGGRKRGAAVLQRPLAAVRTDSRTLEPGDIFVALAGERFDGHAFIEQAVAAGAGAVIAERFPQDASALSQALLIEVKDSLAALGQLAAFRRRLFGGPLRVAAITGSTGKTTVKEMVAAICEGALGDQWAHRHPVLKTGGNYNNLVGLPLSLLPLRAGHQVAILELGMNSFGEIARLTEIADPDVGCISTVHPAHLQGLGSIEGVARAKGELFAGMRAKAICVVNEDDSRIQSLPRARGVRSIGFAVTAAGRRREPLVRITRSANLGERGIRFTLHIGSWSGPVQVPALGLHNVHNCAAAAAIAHALGIAPEAIAAGLGRYRPLEKRMTTVALPSGVKLINDAYNANPASMAAGLRTVAALATEGARRGKCVAALGDMLELGAAAPEQHRIIGRLAADLGYSFLALCGEYAGEGAQAALEAGMRTEQVLLFPEPVAMGRWCADLIARGILGPGDWVLVKGSRGMRMEKMIAALDQQPITERNRETGHAL